ECTMAGIAKEPGTLPVLVFRKAGRTAAQIEGSSAEPKIFVGTDFPSEAPSWLPTIPPEYVRTVRQASYMEPQLLNFASGRYVFESERSEKELTLYLEGHLRAQGFYKWAEYEDGSYGYATLPDGLIRFVRVQITTTKDHGSRCDLLFTQVSNK